MALADKATVADFDREIVSRRNGSLRYFVEQAWHQVEPARRFQGNWHIDAICEHLEAVFHRDILRLVINVPPGSMKSLLCSVLWPAWSWTQQPGTKWITSSYSDKIARRDALRSRQLIESSWYQARWGDGFGQNPDAWSATQYRNTRAGFRFATTVGGGVTGEHADIQTVDDPIKPLDAGMHRVDTSALQNCIEWWDGTMSTRMADPARSARVIVMQRLHQRDLTGHVLDQGGYEHIMLPMRFEPKRRCFVETTGWQDPRDDEGELLWPERFPEEALKMRERELGPLGVAGQEQQRPAPAEGGILKKDWMRYYASPPENIKNVILSWDMSFKDTGTSWVVGQAWFLQKANFYLLDQVRGKWSFVEALRHVVSFYNAALERWGSVKESLVEDKANGPAIISTLKTTVPGMIPINPKGSKPERCSNAAPVIESGNVWLPSPLLAPWVTEMVARWIAFPNVADDDEIDTMTQVINRYKNQRVGAIKLDLSVGSQASPWRM